VPADTGPLQVGEIAAMATTGRLVIRTQPGKGTDSAVYKTNIYPGQRMLILDGPVDASGYPWFRVRLGSIEGWVAASSLTGEPWLVPIRNGRIAFVQDLGDASEAIYTIDPGATGGQTQLLADPSLGRYAQLTWSPDGRRLAFVATPTGPVQGPSEIFIVDADGSNLVQVTNNDVDDDSPAWSPDSQRIAFRQTDPNPTVPGGSSLVVLVRADGGPVKVLGPGANATWSPDGQQLAMTVADGGSSRVWVQGADGTGRRQLADVSVAYARPAWSPDGQNLIVSSSGLFQVGVASGSVTSLSAEPGVMPAWSPGGSIAFTTSGSASPGVFVVGPDGIGPREISHDPGLGAVPVWSPDGRQVLLANDVHAPAIVVVDPTSGTLSAIAGDGTRGSPAWQPRLP
jgi:TolB protein